MLLRLPSTLTIAFLVSIASPTRSAEIDSLTGRSVLLADSSDALERRLDEALEAGVLRANQASAGCDENALYRELRRALATPFIGHVIAEALNEDGTLDRRRVRRVDSIYRDLDLLDNVSVHWKDLSAVVRVGDVLMGVDKLGHFVVEGWEYFEIARLDGKGIAAAMEWGERSERTYFGRFTTGVHSYADLVANFEGMRFWLHVLGRADDPLDTGWRSRRPYVTCRRRFWFAGERRWHRVSKARSGGLRDSGLGRGSELLQLPERKDRGAGARANRRALRGRQRELRLSARSGWLCAGTAAIRGVGSPTAASHLPGGAVARTSVVAVLTDYAPRRAIPETCRVTAARAWPGVSSR